MANALKSVALNAVATVERLVAGKQPPLRDIRNFLLPQYSKALGTAIHATPLIDTLHAVVPGARIIAAASGVALEVFSNNPGVERLIATPDPTKDLPGAVRALRIAHLFNGEPYAVLHTQGNQRSKLTLAAMLSGAPLRVGFAILPQLTTAPLAFNPAISLIANNLEILAALGHGEALHAQLAANPELSEPHVFPAASHTTIAQALLREQGIDESKPIAIFITQTFIAQRKSWRPERFRAVAETLTRDYGMQIVFAGTKAESAAIDELRAPLTVPNANLAGRTGILELAALLQLADVALTLDTGPMHLARAVRLPMVIIAPAWSPVIEWLPLGNPRARILKNADHSVTPDYIIDEVFVADVEQSLRDLLAQYPPRTHIWHV